MTPLLNLKKLDPEDLKYLPNKIPVAGLSFPTLIYNILQDILAGSVVFICDGLNQGISCTLKKYEKRSISEPEGEKSIRGDHDGFIEDMATNISTLRRKLKTVDLKFKNFIVGNISHQTVSVAYLEGIANPNLLQIISDKINQLDSDSFIAIGEIEQIISDHPNSIFPQYLSTERPDKAVAGLLEGKFVIMLQETSFVMIAPAGLKVGFYHYLRLNDPTLEAKHFLSVINGLSSDCKYVMDVEDLSGRTVAQKSSDVRIFADYLISSHKEVCIYTTDNYYATQLN
jgi:spore germination protein KA